MDILRIITGTDSKTAALQISFLAVVFLFSGLWDSFAVRAVVLLIIFSVSIVIGSKQSTKQKSEKSGLRGSGNQNQISIWRVDRQAWSTTALTDCDLEISEAKCITDIDNSTIGNPLKYPLI